MRASEQSTSDVTSIGAPGFEPGTFWSSGCVLGATVTDATGVSVTPVVGSVESLHAAPSSSTRMSAPDDGAFEI